MRSLFHRRRRKFNPVMPVFIILDLSLEMIKVIPDRSVRYEQTESSRFYLGRA
jgi:hypothetical protein